ncbi:hypothetical protein RJ55_01722 [Drechmeria coniospora]|nr:hypothetical protein RJ55_01722 [Drechmeria coniospora]
MFFRSTAAALVASSSLVYAQTSTVCNPLATSTTIQYNGQGAVFTVGKETDAPTIMTSKYIFFGRVDVVLQAAPGQGIVTSVVLQSDDLDEIDWEWIGSDSSQAQTNYFSKGNTSTYDRGKFHPVSNPASTFHTYGIQWNSTAVVWTIDAAVVRTLAYNDANGGQGFPQTPMQVKLGSWVAGRGSAAPGTVQWAGGYADWSKAPFSAYYKSISVVDYAGADEPTTKSVKEYVYGDQSGTFKSIRCN